MINPDSERLLGDATNLPATFSGRQQHYQEAKARRLRELRAELVRRMLKLMLTHSYVINACNEADVALGYLWVHDVPGFHRSSIQGLS